MDAARAENYPLRRRHVAQALLQDRRSLLVVAGLGSCAWDITAAGDDPLNFPLWGAMGGAPAIGLGLALAQPESRGLVITGDGEMLMNVGVLATVATLAPQNLSIICIDNGCHGETGGQPGHTAMNTDLALMAKGAGLASTMTANTADDLAEGAKFLIEAAAPRLLVVRVTAGPPTAFVRNLDPAECRLKFRQATLGSG